MKSPIRIAVTSRSFSKNSTLKAELLERYSHVTFNENGLKLDGDSLVNFLQGHERAITALEVFSEGVLARLPELKVISKFGVGLDMIDLEAMTKFQKRLGWTPGVNRRSVAELTLGFMLALLHRVPQGHERVRSGKWGQIIGNQLTAKTIGIIGCGNIGKEMVHVLAPFQCKILAHDIVDYRDFYQKNNIEAVSLDALLERSDIVSVHVPLDHSTRNMLNVQRLKKMHAGAFLINCARGGIIDEEEVLNMLRSEHLAGAAFDVFANEPPLNRDLLLHPNFLATPHVGGSTEESVLAMGRAAIERLESATIVEAHHSPR